MCLLALAQAVPGLLRAISLREPHTSVKVRRDTSTLPLYDSALSPMGKGTTSLTMPRMSFVS